MLRPPPNVSRVAHNHPPTRAHIFATPTTNPPSKSLALSRITSQSPGVSVHKKGAGRATLRNTKIKILPPFSIQKPRFSISVAPNPQPARNHAPYTEGPLCAEKPRPNQAPVLPARQTVPNRAVPTTLYFQTNPFNPIFTSKTHSNRRRVAERTQSRQTNPSPQIQMRHKST